MNIIKKLLDSKNFVGENTKKTAIVIHHTAGNYRPDLQINYWNGDKLGRVCTHYVIGGLPTNGKDISFDGQVYQAVEEKYCGFHLGIVGNGNRFDKQSIGIEICNYGGLVLSKDGKYYNYVHGIVPNDQVVDLGYVWRGYRYWHKYTENQLISLEKLIKDIAIRNEISINSFQGCDYDSDLLKLPKISGLFVHSNFRKDKFDCPPQGDFVNMLKKLVY